MAFYAILTRYVGPTNRRGSRIAARSGAPMPDGRRPARAIVGYDDTDGKLSAHRIAADTLLARTDPDGRYRIIASGALPDESGYAFVIDYAPDRTADNG